LKEQSSSRYTEKVFQRKVQRLGTSSIIITIPREWARRHKINVGSQVTIFEDGERLIISNSYDGSLLKSSFSIHHSNVCRHAGRVVLCSYISGLDSLMFYSNRPFKNDLLDRIIQTAERFPNTEAGLLSEYELGILFKGSQMDVSDTLLIYGRDLSYMISRLASFLDGGGLDKNEIDARYNDLKQYNFKMLRYVSRGRGRNLNKEHMNRLLSAAVGLLVILTDSLYRFAKDIMRFSNSLSEDEKERLKFLLQVLEVSIVTSTSSIEPPSIKKEEEAYWKLLAILGLEEGLDEIIVNSSPTFAYLLSELFSVAKIVNDVEETLLCYSIFNKYSE